MSKKINSKRIINTLHFGEVELDDEFIFKFPEGLLGFEEYNQFVLISHEDTEPIKWLVSIDDPSIGFPLISPWIIDIEYNPGKSIDLSKEAVLAVVTLAKKNEDMTANLKAPLIFDTNTQTGKQFVLSSEKYSTNEQVIKNKTPETK